MNSIVSDRPIPRWFTAVAVAAVIWQMIGCAMYLMQISVDPATLPRDQRAMWDAAPVWMLAAYAIAVWVGLVGAIFLLRRHRLAEPLLLISLIAIVVQFSALLLVPELRNLTTSDALFLPAMILVIGTVLYQFARTARRSGWLR